MAECWIFSAVCYTTVFSLTLVLGMFFFSHLVTTCQAMCECEVYTHQIECILFRWGILISVSFCSYNASIRSNALRACLKAQSPGSNHAPLLKSVRIFIYGDDRCDRPNMVGISSSKEGCDTLLSFIKDV